MGDIGFLTNKPSPKDMSLLDAVSSLESCSDRFARAWKRKDYQTASDVSSTAMNCFDQIINQILRFRDEMKSNQTYLNTEFKIELEKNTGWICYTDLEEELIQLREVGPGNWSKLHSTEAVECSFEKILMKIKHRRLDLINFRVDSSGKHYFLVGSDTYGRDKKSITEFSVIDFCDHCREIEKIINDM